MEHQDEEANRRESKTSSVDAGSLADDEHPAADDDDDEGDGDDEYGEDEDDGGSDEDGGEEDPGDNPLSHLPDYMIARVNHLRDLDVERQSVMDLYLAERAALEKKYAGLFEPLYAERAEVVRGDKDKSIATSTESSNPVDESSEATEDPVEAARSSHEHNAASVDAPGRRVLVDESRSKGIPHFWVTAMSNNETIAEWITEPDVDCLENLRDVTCVDHDDGKGFQLHFHFAPNDYFENSILTKTYEIPNLLLSDEPLLKIVRGTSVQWKPGRALTYRMVKKKQRGKGKHAGQVRTVQKKEEVESFFKWFEPPDMPPLDSMDEEKAEELEAIFDEDYEVASAFRNHIIPRAVLWFTGEAENEQVNDEADEEQEGESASE